MTVIEKVLLRKDIASIALAAVLAFLTFQLLVSLTTPLVSQLAGPTDLRADLTGADFYVPAISFVLQLFVLELLLTLVVVVRHFVYGKSSKKRK